MSRETNSLLLRHGITNFWSSYLSIPILGYLNLQLNSLFVLLLRNYFLIPLKIQYFKDLIVLFVFYFKEDQHSFLHKFLTLKKLSLNFLLYRKVYGLNLIKTNSNKVLTFSFYLVFLILKFFLITMYYLILTGNYKLYLNNFFLMSLKPKKLNRVYYKFNYCKRYKIKFINYMLKFKILGLFLKSLIYKYTKKSLNIVIKSLLDKPLFYNFSSFNFKYRQNSSVRKKVFLIILSFIYFKAFILNTYITMIIKKTKNKTHIKNLINFFTSLKVIFNKNLVPILGLKFKISGRLNGKLRKGMYGYKIGTVKLLSLNINIDYSCMFIYTQYGTFSSKIWFNDKNDYNLKKQIKNGL